MPTLDPDRRKPVVCPQGGADQVTSEAPELPGAWRPRSAASRRTVARGPGTVRVATPAVRVTGRATSSKRIAGFVSPGRQLTAQDTAKQQDCRVGATWLKRRLYLNQNRVAALTESRRLPAWRWTRAALSNRIKARRSTRSCRALPCPSSVRSEATYGPPHIKRLQHPAPLPAQGRPSIQGHMRTSITRREVSLAGRPRSGTALRPRSCGHPRTAVQAHRATQDDRSERSGCARLRKCRLSPNREPLSPRLSGDAIGERDYCFDHLLRRSAPDGRDDRLLGACLDFPRRAGSTGRRLFEPATTPIVS